MRLASALPLLLILALADEALPHDFWAEMPEPPARVGAVVDVRLRVGDGFVGEEFPRSSAHCERFEVLGPTGTLPVEGRDQEAPAGRVRPLSAGLHWIVYRSRDCETDVEAAKFGPYLEQEGNSRWLADWKAFDPSARLPVREAFSRCVKGLLEVLPAEGVVATVAQPAVPAATIAPSFDTPVGLRLEIVPLADPRRLAAGANLSIRLLLDGRPYADQQVTALSASNAAHPVRVRTDAEGHASMPLAHRGRWLLTSVHLERAAEGEDARYRSTWTALTFDLPASAPAR